MNTHSSIIELLSIQVGLPKTYGDPNATAAGERVWETGFFKESVHGPVAVSATGLAGDGQADRSVHGGPDKAICAYPSEHFPGWNAALPIVMGPGAFGENFTLRGATENEVCIGDIYRLANLVIQVSQPRQPCWKLARRWGVKKLAALVQNNGQTGWYFRVLDDGMVESPAQLKLLERPYPQWTIAACNRVMHHQRQDYQAAAQLGSLPELSASWQETLAKRIAPV